MWIEQTEIDFQCQWKLHIHAENAFPLDNCWLLSICDLWFLFLSSIFNYYAGSVSCFQHFARIQMGEWGERKKADAFCVFWNQCIRYIISEIAFERSVVWCARVCVCACASLCVLFRARRVGCRRIHANSIAGKRNQIVKKSDISNACVWSNDA